MAAGFANCDLAAAGCARGSWLCESWLLDQSAMIGGGLVGAAAMLISIGGGMATWGICSVCTTFNFRDCFV